MVLPTNCFRICRKNIQYAVTTIVLPQLDPETFIT